MATATQSVKEICAQAKRAAIRLGAIDSQTKDAALAAVADAVESRIGEILEAEEAGLPQGSVSLIGGGDRSDLVELVRQEGLVDLVIPRGGDALKRVLKDNATVPVIYAAAGNCHVYIDASADPEMAKRIAFNA